MDQNKFHKIAKTYFPNSFSLLFSSIMIGYPMEEYSKKKKIGKKVRKSLLKKFGINFLINWLSAFCMFYAFGFNTDTL